MPNNLEMESVIEDAINDTVADTTPLDTTTDVSDNADTSADTGNTTDTSADASTDDTADGTSQVVTPGAKDDLTDQSTSDDPFAKKFGLQAQSVTGRENRIPYSRVKKIVEKNERETVARVTKEVEAKLQPKLHEFETKVTDYEGRLTKVAQFEHIMENDPRTFLGLLSQVPAYKEFFDWVAQAAQGGQQQTSTEAAKGTIAETMPQPDQTLADGSKVYSMEGLQALLDWQSANVESRVTKNYETKLNEFQQRYKPIEDAWQQQEHMARIVPVIEKQIADARQWPQFNENEADIVAALKADKNLSLEGAYRQVVFPRLAADRNKIRTEVLAEIQKKPVASAAPVSGVKPGAQSSGPRSLEDIIAEAAGIKA